MNGALGYRVSRSPDRLTVEHPNFTPVQGDVTDVESFTAVTSGADAVVISVQGTPEGDFAPENSTHALAAGTAAAALDGMTGAPYVLQIGGATTMLPTVEDMLANAPFPVSEGSPLYAMLIGHKVALDTYRASDIDWTVLTPPFNIMGWTPDGISDTQQRGEYRTQPRNSCDDEGNSAIYVADLAARPSTRSRIGLCETTIYRWLLSQQGEVSDGANRFWTDPDNGILAFGWRLP